MPLIPIATQRLWIPRRAPNLNDLFRARGQAHGGGSRRSDGYQDIKKSWAETVKWSAHLAQLKPVQRCRLSFEIRETDKRRDPDNFSGACAKLILDGLVSCGVLPSDNWGAIAGLEFSWRVDPTPGVWVVIEEVAGG